MGFIPFPRAIYFTKRPPMNSVSKIEENTGMSEPALPASASGFGFFIVKLGPPRLRPGSEASKLDSAKVRRLTSENPRLPK